MSNEARAEKWLVVVLIALLALVPVTLGGWWFLGRGRPASPAVVAPVTPVVIAPAPAADAAASAPAEAALPAGKVYDANFDTDEAGSAWSNPNRAYTPNVQRQFVGPFNEKPVDFTLANLPPHAFVRLRFELITYDRWNGDGENFGRDLWDLRVVGGQPLIHTTFNNCGFFTNNNQQSFPDQYPWYPTHDAWTGASSKQSLGHVTSQGPDSWSDDSTYNFDLSFPHADDTLKLEFKTQIKHHDGKPYGFLSFRVDTESAATATTDDQLAGWWGDLEGEDPVKAYEAVWSMIGTGDAATTYIAARLPGAAAAAPAPVNIDMTKKWVPGNFTYSTHWSRQMARGTHVLEVIHTPAAQALLAKIGYQGTPQGGPKDAWTR